MDWHRTDWIVQTFMVPGHWVLITSVLGRPLVLFSLCFVRENVTGLFLQAMFICCKQPMHRQWSYFHPHPLFISLVFVYSWIFHTDLGHLGWNSLLFVCNHATSNIHFSLNTPLGVSSLFIKPKLLPHPLLNTKRSNNKVAAVKCFSESASRQTSISSCLRQVINSKERMMWRGHRYENTGLGHGEKEIKPWQHHIKVSCLMRWIIQLRRFSSHWRLFVMPHKL